MSKPKSHEAYEFQNRVGEDNRPKWLLDAVRMGVVQFVMPKEGPPHLVIHTLKGVQTAKPGDWIIKREGELFPVTADQFIRGEF